jgi:hypothetical protein
MAYNVKYVVLKDRLELFKDFTISLLNNIYEFRLDADSSADDDNIYNHFNWCYNKTCEDFLKEEIDFRDNQELKSYFYGYYSNQFYHINKIKSFSYYEKFWNDIFNVENQTNKNLSKILIEIYIIFNTTINNKI